MRNSLGIFVQNVMHEGAAVFNGQYLLSVTS